MPGDKVNSKLRKGAIIERNWNCSVQECVPFTIRPRGANFRIKPSVGNNIPEKQWKDWSLKMLTELERMSGLTVGKLAFAQELMTLEVKQRQQDLTNHQRKFQELLRSDLHRINQDLGMRTDEDEGDEEGSDEEEDRDEEEGEADGMNDLRPSIQDDGDEIETIEDDDDIIIENQHPANRTRPEADQTEIKAEPIDDDTAVFPPDPDQPEVNGHSKGNGVRPATKGSARSSPKSKAAFKNRIRILRLRADATRLKQEAAKREAEAYELEVKMLLDEAKGDE